MKSTFYELLLVSPDADSTTLRRAWQDALANLVRRTRIALDQGQDIARLDEERALLEEAWAVLSDPLRRARYDRYLALTGGGALPQDAEELWTLVSGSMLDPGARATLDLLANFTGLRTEKDDALKVPSAPRTTPAEPARAYTGPAPVPPPPAPRPPPQSAPPPKAEIPDLTDALVAVPALADKKVPPWRAAPATASAAPSGGGSTEMQDLVMRYGYSGELIKKVREGKGISLEQVAAQSRISLRYLEAIEANEHARLPATTFVRGYLREVARILGLDAETVANGYLANMSRSRE